LVKAGFGTPVEIATQWSIVDVWDAHVVLTAFDIAEARAAKAVR
jgi:hypothetical protein